MAKHTKSERQKFIEDLARAQELFEQGKYAEAREVFEQVRAAAQKLGIRSGHVAWGMAMACECGGDLAAAMQLIIEALESDPLAGPFNRTLDIIAESVRQALVADDRAPGDETPRLYQLLVQVGEADEGAHLAMARYHLATGKSELALKLVDAVTMVYPSSNKAWGLRAEIAVAQGDHEGAAQAQAEAAALGAEPVPFAIPGKVRG